MKEQSLIVVGLVLLLAIMMPSEATVDVHGQEHNLSERVVTWDHSTFPGFYYDLDKNLGAEQLTFSLSNFNPASATLSDQQVNNGARGIVYKTQAQLKNFTFRPWGQYEVIGFLGDRYFAAYDKAATQGMANAGETYPFLFDKSKNRNLMTYEQISKILIDNNTEILISSSSPLKLKEGYEIALKSISSNGTQAILELRKNGQSVDTKIVQSSIPGATMSDKTYYFKTDLGGTSGIVTIAVHFKNVFHGPDTNSATVDGIFQISESPTDLNSSQHYGKMSIRNVNVNPTDLSILMDNKDNQIILSKDKDVSLMGKIHIKTANQEIISADMPLRYYIYSEESSN